MIIKKYVLQAIIQLRLMVKRTERTAETGPPADPVRTLNGIKCLVNLL